MGTHINELSSFKFSNDPSGKKISIKENLVHRIFFFLVIILPLNRNKLFKDAIL